MPRLKRTEKKILLLEVEIGDKCCVAAQIRPVPRFEDMYL